MILYTSNKKLCKFLADKNPDDYSYVVISENLLSENKFPNTYIMPFLVPPPSCLRIFYNEGLTDEYMDAVLRFYKTDVEAIRSIAVIVRAAVIDDIKLIFVNTPTEVASRFLNLLASHIEMTYGIKVLSMKDYHKDPVEAERPYAQKEKEEVEKKIQAVVKYLEEDLSTDATAILYPDKIYDVLKDMKKKKLEKICSSKNIALYGSERKDKDIMISKIMKRVTIF